MPDPLPRLQREGIPEGGEPIAPGRAKHAPGGQAGLDPDSDCDPDTDSGAALRPEDVASPQGDEDVATPIGRSFGKGDEDFAVSMPLNAEE